ncbi:hypothetical protein DFH28DRAFT_528119 [Melampsora americana]|nr:hypothetical protein DFH28DRAFT_528119 [Melampsora americana]
MAIIHFVAILVLCVVTAQYKLATAADSVRDFTLQRRGLPPCLDKAPAGKDLSDSEMKRLLDVDKKARKDRGWLPSICGKNRVNCVRMPKGVTTRPSIARIAANFTLFNGDIVQVYRYWQSTAQWTFPGGTVNSYMAHGVDWICVKGSMRVTFWSSKDIIAGDPSDRNKSNCKCHYPADGDKTLLVDQKNTDKEHQNHQNQQNQENQKKQKKQQNHQESSPVKTISVPTLTVTDLGPTLGVATQ